MDLKVELNLAAKERRSELHVLVNVYMCIVQNILYNYTQCQYCYYNTGAIANDQHFIFSCILGEHFSRQTLKRKSIYVKNIEDFKH